MRFIDRTGELGSSNEGYKIRIKTYRNANDIDIEILDENKYTIENSTYQVFKYGNIKNPFHRSVYKTGYIGVGEYRAYTRIRGKAVAINGYKKWCAMLERCYGEKISSKNRTYSDCFVCDEWHNFQNFARWYSKNYYSIEGERMELDKDIIKKGNRIYSPENCCIVPKPINVILTNSNAKRGDFPVGVHYEKRKDRYVATCNIANTKKARYLGMYKNPEDAFYAYKKYKEQQIKTIADKYKEILPSSVYKSILNYKIDIDD